MEGEIRSPGDAAREGGRTPFARRLDDPQRVEGAGRWSVDATRRRCSLCSGALPDHHAFHSVLEPAPVLTETTLTEGVEQDLFVRRDYCEECFSTSPPPAAFAHWRGVLAPPPGGVRKIVNLASLLAHFHALVETPALDDGAVDGEEGGRDRDGEGGTESAFAGGGPEAHRPDRTRIPEPRLRLAYLLALFLVRRRMLRWEGVEDGILRLRCRESDRPVDLPVPELIPAELESAVQEFEELFQ